jgi:hypothetical protein
MPLKEPADRMPLYTKAVQHPGSQRELPSRGLQIGSGVRSDNAATAAVDGVPIGQGMVDDEVTSVVGLCRHVCKDMCQRRHRRIPRLDLCRLSPPRVRRCVAQRLAASLLPLWSTSNSRADLRTTLPQQYGIMCNPLHTPYI